MQRIQQAASMHAQVMTLEHMPIHVLVWLSQHMSSDSAHARHQVCARTDSGQKQCKDRMCNAWL
jgi:macrodomain Ter protein organizer (MatP/YcbG family)